MTAQYNLAEVHRLIEWARAGIESTSAPFTELGIVFASAEHRDAAMANLGAMADQLEAACSFADLGRAYARMKQLDEICEAHPRNDDTVGAAAEDELAELVPRMRKMLDRIQK